MLRRHVLYPSELRARSISLPLTRLGLLFQAFLSGSKHLLQVRHRLSEDGVRELISSAVCCSVTWSFPEPEVWHSNRPGRAELESIRGRAHGGTSVSSETLVVAVLNDNRQLFTDAVDGLRRHVVRSTGNLIKLNIYVDGVFRIIEIGGDA